MHLLGIDWEDWYCDVESCPPSAGTRAAFERQHQRVLQVLSAAGIQATFFLLGRTVERHTDLVRSIVDAGHEVGSHGFGHGKLTTMSREQVRDDLARSIDVIGAAAGTRPIGFRAPYLSVGPREAAWMYDELAAAGFAWSSSVLPTRSGNRGLPGLSVAPARRPTSTAGASVVEFPLAVLQVGARRVPVAGGGFWRALPGSFLRAAVRRYDARRIPFSSYLHPHEFDPEPLRSPRGPARDVWVNLGRTSVPGKLAMLAREFRFGRFGDAAASIL